MMKPSDKFKNMVDEIILEESATDPELADGIKWLDEQAKKQGVDFYEITYKLLLKYNAKKLAKEWNNERSKNT